MTYEDWALVNEALEATICGDLKSATIAFFKADPNHEILINGIESLLHEAGLYFPPQLQQDFVRNYYSQKQINDELGMRRTYKAANAVTRKTIDILFMS